MKSFNTKFHAAPKIFSPEINNEHVPDFGEQIKVVLKAHVSYSLGCLFIDHCLLWWFRCHFLQGADTT